MSPLDHLFRRHRQSPRNLEAQRFSRPAVPKYLGSLVFLSTWQREEHRDLILVLYIVAANRGDEIPLLKLKCDKNVCRSGKREHEMPQGHARRSPERDHKTQHDGMAHQFVKAENFELHAYVFFAAKV